MPYPGLHNAKILLDSISKHGHRLTTFECVFPRIILAEWNTHRAFCLAADTELEFDLPQGRGGRRVYRMRIDHFVDKWTGGARRTASNPKQDFDTSWVESERLYTSTEAASYLGMANPSWINQLCRSGDISAVKKPGSRAWVIAGHDILRWRQSAPAHTRFDIQSRLRAMSIRQFNEATGDIQTSQVVDATFSGMKEVFNVTAGDYRVAGSKDHLVLAHTGWKTIGELSNNDFVVVRKYGKRDEDLVDPLRLKKIDGRWRSTWQNGERARLTGEDPLCRRCRQRDGQVIHHIVPVYQDPTRAFDRSNITLLCEQCHRAQHSIQDWQGGMYLYGALAKVTRIESRGVEPTYDLAIAGDYPNFLANGVVVHNSRNSASSRAIPVEKMIRMVVERPYVPTTWGKNQKGMQAVEEILGEDALSCEKAWLLARDYAVEQAQLLLEIGVHKQTTNRLLEPFLWHTVINTATEYQNFYGLRAHKDAHPDIQIIAQMMIDAQMRSTPQRLGDGEWHTPYAETHEKYSAEFDLRKVTAGRAARVSYWTHDGKRDPEADVALHDRLLASGHMSPLEHAARPMNDVEYDQLFRQPKVVWNEAQRAFVQVIGGDGNPAFTHFCGPFEGWVSYRKHIPHEENYGTFLASQDFKASVSAA